MQQSAVQPGLAPHRQCVGCGYDIGALPLTAMCPECGQPVADTCSRVLVRDDPARCVRLASWLHWLWWSTLAAGVCVTLFILSTTVLAGLGFGRSFAWVGVIAAVTSVLTVAVSAVGIFSMVARDSRVARRARIATLATAALIVSMLALLLAADQGLLNERQVTDTFLKFSLIPLSLVSFAMFAWGAHALAWIAARTDRFVVRLQTKRFAFLSTLWHAVVLAIVLPLSLLLALIPNPSDFERIIVPLAGAWFVSWIGHAGWAIYAMVAVARLRGAVRAEARTCRSVLAAHAPASQEPA